MDLNRLVRELRQSEEDASDGLFFSAGNKPVQVLSEDGDVFDVVDVEYDPEAGVTYLKVELAG